MAELWSPKDSLRTMTEKFNASVEDIEHVKQAAETSHTATNLQVTQLEQSTATKFGLIYAKLDKKLEIVTAQDINLENVNNTSDVNKPVSTAQATAIALAKTQAMAEQLTSEEELILENSPEPQISPVISEFIKQIVQNIAAQEGATPYGVATGLMLGVVKSSAEVNVASDGKMTVPALSEISHIKLSLASLIQDYSAKQLQIGDITKLKTVDKTLVGAINELYDLIKS